MDKTQLFNLALDASGSRHTVASPTESSREAQTCARWYDISRDAVLQAAFWPAAEGNRRLSVLAERDTDESWVSTDPTPGWRYAYAAPDDMLAPRYISDFSQFRAGVYDGQRAIMANTEQAILSYTARIEEIDIWDPALQLAIVYALAAHITLPLQGKPARAQLNEDKANQLILQARVLSANMDMETYDTMPDWFAARGYSAEPAISRYIYPYGPMISVLSAAGVS